MLQILPGILLGPKPTILNFAKQIVYLYCYLRFQEFLVEKAGAQNVTLRIIFFLQNCFFLLNSFFLIYFLIPKVVLPKPVCIYQLLLMSKVFRKQEITKSIHLLFFRSLIYSQVSIKRAARLTTYICSKNLEEKDGQTRVLRSVSAQVVACLAVITLIKDCNKILKSHGKQKNFSHCRDLLVH